MQAPIADEGEGSGGEGEKRKETGGKGQGRKRDDRLRESGRGGEKGVREHELREDQEGKVMMGTISVERETREIFEQRRTYGEKERRPDDLRRTTREGVLDGG